MVRNSAESPIGDYFGGMNFEPKQKSAVKIAWSPLTGNSEIHLHLHGAATEGFTAQTKSDEHVVSGAARITRSDLGLGLKETNTNVR